MQYTNARNFLWDKLSVAKLLHHGMHVYLSISCQIIQNGCTQSTPHEAFRQAASLATLSIIQFSHFCQFNIVNGTWISLITIFNMPSRTWLWELFFFFFFFSLRALKLLVHILYLSSYDRNWLTNLQKFPANYSFLCSFKHWKCLFPFSHLLIWYIVFFLNVKNLNFPEHNEAFTDSCFLTFSPIHIFPVVFSLRALETEWQLSKYRVGVRFVWCFLAVNNA